VSPYKRWFFANHEGWSPELYEWAFTKFPVDVKIREREEQAVFAAIEPSMASDSSVLEIGSGTGNYTLPLARSCSEVVAADYSRSMLSYLSGRLSDEALSNVELRLGGFPDGLGMSKRFDAIVSVGVLNYVRNFDLAVRSLAGSLKAGGRAVFTVPMPTFEGRLYLLTELVTRRRIWLRSQTYTQKVVEAAGLDVESMNTAGISGKGLTLVVSAVAGTSVESPPQRDAELWKTDTLVAESV
jgi:cyclopropane fatty-acyl-phospholipid synthase-like methyltransferase